MHVWQNPVMVAIVVLLVALLIIQEVHARRARRLRKTAAAQAGDRPGLPRRDGRTSPVWKDRGTL